jgi:hypothetical protein
MRRRTADATDAEGTDARRSAGNSRDDGGAARERAALVAAAVLVQLAGKAGDATAPMLLAARRPRLLLALNANDAHCALTTGAFDRTQWLAISLARRLIEDPLFFRLGRAHRSSALAWLHWMGGEPARAAFESLEASFRRASVMAVVIEPGAMVCCAAGATRMEPRLFWTLNVLGTCARLIVIWLSGAVLERPIAYLHTLVTQHQRAAAAASLVVTALSCVPLMRRASLGCSSVVRDDATAPRGPAGAPPPPPGTLGKDVVDRNATSA